MVSPEKVYSRDSDAWTCELVGDGNEDVGDIPWLLYVVKQTRNKELKLSLLLSWSPKLRRSSGSYHEMD